MSLISLIDASKDFGIRTLFADLTLHIREGDRLGLIGPNGSGKSTLLKVLAGEEAWGRRATLLVAVEGRARGPREHSGPRPHRLGTGVGRLRRKTRLATAFQRTQRSRCRQSGQLSAPG